MLTIVGGLYAERCIQPLWNAVFGSGGRAAAAVSHIVQGTTLVAYVPEALRRDAEVLAGSFGFALRPQDAFHPVAFDYLHPLSTPRIGPSPERILANPPIHVRGKLVLRFGMIEGDAVVNAEAAVYDPQSALGAKSFSQNGSCAERLAIVLNRAEAACITGTDDPAAAAQWLIREEGAEVAVVKMGSRGALVTTRSSAEVVPAYGSARVWKIGSGDVFSAAFAAFWGAHQNDPFRAADLASRAVSIYCNTRRLPILGEEELRAGPLVPIKPRRGTVYLAGPFFDLAQRWLVEEARSLLLDLGAQVFSPAHEVGPGPGTIVAPEDLRGIEGSDVVFAILNGLDAGTLFEVGYAVKRGMPVVCLAQALREEDLKMVEGSGCEVVDDFASALYRTIWKLPEE